ncbi:MAG: FtsW/RodA/SpoVE family cell cycle protein [Mobilitalea sp.]
MFLIIKLIKYLMLLLIGIYTYYSFNVFRYKSKKLQDKAYRVLTAIIFVLHFTGYFALYFQTEDVRLVVLYAEEVLLFLLILIVYKIIYPKLSKLLLRNMLMLLTVGFIVLTRLSYDMAAKQVVIAALSFLVCSFIPFAMKSFSWLVKFGWIYGLLGITLLLTVLVVGTASNGATNWIDIGGISIQPSELVKLLFVMSIAALFQEGTDFKRVCIISVLAGAHVLVLVASNDLGGALIFFVTYIFILYAATSNVIYLLSGFAGGCMAAVIAYQVFDHVKVRVMAWQDPFSYIDKQGYQITQSLFAIGTGGWFGMGLNQGLPTDIPVVESDFIFSAISEELGGLFALCILLIYISCFIMLINIALEQEETFYRLIALGFSVMFGFQIILCIGGVIKFIPSTGVTLPLISQGGSSIFATILMFMILQGVSMRDKRQKKETQIPKFASREKGIGY